MTPSNTPGVVTHRYCLDSHVLLFKCLSIFCLPYPVSQLQMFFSHYPIKGVSFGSLKNVKRVQLLPLSWELAHIVGENNFETEVKFIIQSVCNVLFVPNFYFCSTDDDFSL